MNLATDRLDALGSSKMEGKMLEVFEVGPCDDAYQMGFLIGQRFGNKIRSRLSRDLILQNQLLPFAKSPHSQPLIKALINNNQKKYPRYWDELLGTAEGSGVPVLEVITIIRSNKAKFHISVQYVRDFTIVHVLCR